MSPLNLLEHEINILLLKVARELKYRELTSLIGKNIAVRDRVFIVNEAINFVSKFFSDCEFSEPEQKFLERQIAKYGILDLRFSAPQTMLDVNVQSGVELLRSLYFVNDNAQDLANELEDEFFACIEQLRDDINENKTHLLLFLYATDLRNSEMPLKERLAQTRDTSLLNFPITFTVTDACVSNSPFVWINKHFYW